ncbi:hypothetical protein [Polynucleobacter asymbioticus]|jgi:hypothetical protein|uniref:Uncharacterized protein n=1 Tax=Polynucleobacter asymbioticus TaxID=576611 RepID=A0AAC9IUM6_9BURK|nr:hypothetical protein [Polynucleobacter asymbioticus]APB99010.1 hypothetical protein A4F89_06560 [Polynucleobacter asymbioticus]APC01312.1 hypothetical protein AOC25_06660 [Polynucleobacter asymbioticus]
MSLFGALALGATSGAGEAVQKAALEQQRADLDIQKAHAITQDTAALVDQQRQQNADKFMSSATSLAEEKKLGLINSVGASSPDELSKEHRDQYDSITPFNSQIIKEAGLKSGYIKPEDAVKNDLTAEKMMNLKQYYDGKLENLRDANDMKLTRANMNADYASQSKTALAAAIGLIKADISSTTSQINQLQRDKDTYLTNNDVPKDPEKLKIYNTNISVFDTDMKTLQSDLKASQEQGKIVRDQLGLKSPEVKTDGKAGPKAVDFNSLK